MIQEEVINSQAEDPQIALDETLTKETLRKVLASLNPRHRTVIDLRYGLTDGRQRTLQEVGQELGLTRERIRQIEAEALKKLRHPSRSRNLKPLLKK